MMRDRNAAGTYAAARLNDNIGTQYVASTMGTAEYGSSSEINSSACSKSSFPSGDAM